MLKGKAPAYLGNICEVDESLVGGKEKNKHRSKRTKGTQGRSTKTKTVMFGILERGEGDKSGKITALKVPDVERGTLQPIIQDTVKEGTIVISDEWKGYRGLSKSAKTIVHLAVNHSAGLYVSGIAHTNTIEGFWSLFKRGVYGIYHSVSPKHIDRYLNEFSGRYNSIGVSEESRFNKVLSNCKGRLKYKDLISHV